MTQLARASSTTRASCWCITSTSTTGVWLETKFKVGWNLDLTLLHGLEAPSHPNKLGSKWNHLLNTRSMYMEFEFGLNLDCVDMQITAGFKLLSNCGPSASTFQNKTRTDCERKKEHTSQMIPSYLWKTNMTYPLPFSPALLSR